ncbi:MAG TPA: peptide ligase PGM1-related protein [Kofleriaceae bacterium]
MLEQILFGDTCTTPRTVVSIQSVSLGGLTAKYLRGLNYFEERNAYFVDLLRNENCTCIVVLSDDVDRAFLHHTVNEGAKACNLSVGDLARRWKTVFVPTDGRSSLSELLLGNRSALDSLRELVSSCENPILDFWTVTERELELAEALGLPHLGLRRELLAVDSKSNSRAIFESLNIPHPLGYQDICNVDDARRALADLSARSPARSFLIKLNCEEAGNGIARIQRSMIREPLADFVASLEVSKAIPVDVFVSEIAEQGAVVEEYIEASHTAFPSVKMNVLPDGRVENLATHDQVLIGMAYAGSQFPADEAYRSDLMALGHKIATSLAARGVRGIVSTDFIATRDVPTEPWSLWGLEVNARKGATTHPYFWSRLLTGATYDRATGRLVSPTGHITYQSSEYVQADGLKTVSPGELLKAMSDAGLAFDHKTHRGALVHMATSMRQFSKFGVTIVGHGHQEITELQKRIVQLARQLTNPAKPGSTGGPAARHME